MDDDSRKRMLGRTEFWIVVTIIIMFTGCILIINSVLDIEHLLAIENELRIITEFIDELNVGLPDIALPTPTP